MSVQTDVFDALAHVEAFPYVWYWRQQTSWRVQVRDGRIVALSPPRVFDRERKGARCRVLVRGAMNSALIEFADGWRVVTSRGGLRRARACADRPARGRVRRGAAEARS